MASSSEFSLSSINIPLVVRTTSSLLGLMISSAMARALFQPNEFCETFGLPVNPYTPTSKKATEKPESAFKQNPWLLCLAARNGSLGITILVLNYLGETKATGVVMTVGAIMLGSGDIVATAKYGTRSGVITHSIGATLFSVVGLGLLWTEGVGK